MSLFDKVKEKASDALETGKEAAHTQQLKLQLRKLESEVESAQRRVRRGCIRSVRGRHALGEQRARRARDARARGARRGRGQEGRDRAARRRRRRRRDGAGEPSAARPEAAAAAGRRPGARPAAERERPDALHVVQHRGDVLAVERLALQQLGGEALERLAVLLEQPRGLGVGVVADRDCSWSRCRFVSSESAKLSARTVRVVSDSPRPQSNTIARAIAVQRSRSSPAPLETSPSATCSPARPPSRTTMRVIRSSRVASTRSSVGMYML